MHAKVRMLLTLTLAASALWLTSGCDTDGASSAAAPIYDDIGETDIAARERYYLELQKKKQAEKNQPQAEMPKPVPAIGEIGKVRIPETPRRPARNVPAPQPLQERAAKGLNNPPSNQHYFNVGEMELEY
ncbi:MAG: hypothetical protein M5U26_24305 [Planctomycetota bacterium]|nr:hypothetical protein [Planctomycetota bacterium]